MFRWFGFALLLLPMVVPADVAPNKRHEVERLLALVAATPCLIERNGTRHSGADAVGHIQRKYDHFRREIHNTEDFIELAASKSTISGQYYRVYCTGREPQRVRDWLLRELEVYRLQRRYKPRF